MSNRSLEDLDGIYTYISETLIEPGIALSLVDKIESGILSLDFMPHRCPVRNIGTYANKGYRQLFIKNYTVIFRIDEENKQVVIITVRYSASNF
jgi:plasmid stabilization system protein ParE